MTYTLRDCTVNAIQANTAYQLAGEDWYSLPLWVIKKYEKGGLVYGENTVFLDGVKLDPTDYIVLNHHTGDVYICNQGLFESLYETEHE